jgi:hypothetical protein
MFCGQPPLPLPLPLPIINIPQSLLFYENNNSYLELNNKILIGSGEYTIDLWVWLSPSITDINYVILSLNSNLETNFTMYINTNNNSITITDRMDGYTLKFNFQIQLIFNRWKHIAVVRDSNHNETAFLNGVRAIGADSDNGFSDGIILDAFPYGNINIVANNINLSSFNGYLAGLRIVTGTALYNPLNSNLVVPSLPLSITNGTKLLLNVVGQVITDDGPDNINILNSNVELSSFYPS